MNKIKIFAYITAALLWSCGQNNDELSHHHDHSHHDAETEHTDEHDEHDEHDANHGQKEEEPGHKHSDSEILLHTPQAEKFGVKCEVINPGEFHEVIKATGQIIEAPGSGSVVSAPTSGIVKYAASIQPGKNVGAGQAIASISATAISGGDRNAADRAALSAAEKELNRIKPLYEQKLVTEKDYNAAVQAYETAKAQYSPSAASGTAKAISAGVVTQLLVPNGQYVEAGTPIATISSNRRLTLRADVPDRYQRLLPAVSTANLRLPYSDEVISLSERNASKVSGSESTTRVYPGYLPVYFAFDNHGDLPAQTIVDVYLTGSQRQGVISVPTSALSEQQGQYFVYTGSGECYEKVPVKIGASDGQRTEILSGLHGGENVVTQGVIAVRLAETSGVVPEGHSHSH